MNFKNRLLGVAAVAVAAGSLFATQAGAAAPPPIDVANGRVNCSTISGIIKFLVPLHIGGVTPGNISVTAKLYGCETDAVSTALGVSIKQGIGGGALTSATNDCAGLSGLGTTAGTLNVDWTVNPGTAKLIPTTLVGTALKQRTSLNITQTNGTTLIPTNWTTGGYGLFQVGTDVDHGGTSAPSATGQFTGGDGGSTITLDAATNFDLSKIVTDCFSVGGVKALTFGIGRIGNL